MKQIPRWTSAKTMRWTLVFALAASAAQLGFANGLEVLDTFMKSTRSGSAEFTQVVEAPAREGQAAKVRRSSGTFDFMRPNRFRFLYKKPFEQTIVADGQTLWLYDADLNQVTQRKQAQALGSTPAALIASAADLRALEADFELKRLPDQDGLQWVSATPRSRDAQLQSIKVGFRSGDLAVLDIQDAFGQRSRLSFTAMRINAITDAAIFQFVPPAGADVIRQ